MTQTTCDKRIWEDAEVAYEAYRAHFCMLTTWAILPEDHKDAWFQASHAMRRIAFCPIHWDLEHTDALEPFTQCIQCMRNERDSLRIRQEEVDRVMYERDNLKALLTEARADLAAYQRTMELQAAVR